jgi:hypothetical protein
LGAKFVAVALPAAIAVALVGCGQELNKPKAAPTEVPPGQKLQGRWTTNVKPSELAPGKPRQLAAGGSRWTMRLAAQGGPTNSPTFTLVTPKGKVFESARLGVEHDTLLLHDEPCGQKKSPAESLYRYKLKGKTLKILKFRNGCVDKTAETILTSHPWTKQHGG